MEFREAKIQQEEECLEMMKEFYQMSGYPFDSKRASGNFREFIANDQLGKFWIISLSNKTIGYLILTFGYSFEYGGRDAFIDELYLKEEFRNQGFGTHILGSLDFLAGKNKVNAIHLEVEKTNDSGNRLYLKSGYKGNDRALLTKIISS